MHIYTFKKRSLFSPKPSIEDLRYKDLDKKPTNTEFTAKRDSLDFDKFGIKIFCNSSFNNWIESVNHSKEMDLYPKRKIPIYQNGQYN